MILAKLNNQMRLAVAGAVLVVGVALSLYLGELAQLWRVLLALAALVVAAGIGWSTDRGRRLRDFARGANLERQKVVWPPRREALQVTAFVLLLVVVVGLYLWVLDWISFQLIYEWLLRISVDG